MLTACDDGEPSATESTRRKAFSFDAISKTQWLSLRRWVSKKRTPSLSLVTKFTYIQGCHKDIKSKGNFMTVDGSAALIIPYFSFYWGIVEGTRWHYISSQWHCQYILTIQIWSSTFKETSQFWVVFGFPHETFPWFVENTIYISCNSQNLNEASKLMLNLLCISLQSYCNQLPLHKNK